MPNLYSHLLGYVSERDINGIRVYCVLARGIYYVSYMRSLIAAPIASGATENAAYENFTRL